MHFSTRQGEGRVYSLALLTQDHTPALRGNAARRALIEIKMAARNACRPFCIGGYPLISTPASLSQMATDPGRLTLVCW